VPLIDYFSGQPFPDNRIPAGMLSATALNLAQFYPHSNAGPNRFITTQNRATRRTRRHALRPHLPREGPTLRPVCGLGEREYGPASVAGANVPGFPVGEDLGTHSAVVSETHVLGAAAVNVARLGFSAMRSRPTSR